VTDYKTAEAALEDQMREVREEITQDVLRGRNPKDGFCVLYLHTTGPHNIEGEDRGVVIFTAITSTPRVHKTVAEAIKRIITQIGEVYDAKPVLIIRPEEQEGGLR